MFRKDKQEEVENVEETIVENKEQVVSKPTVVYELSDVDTIKLLQDAGYEYAHALSLQSKGYIQKAMSLAFNAGVNYQTSNVNTQLQAL